MQDDLFRAILAMDSYNHGAVRSISFTNEWTSVGNATIIANSNLPNNGFDEASIATATQLGFGATAYSWTAQQPDSDETFTRKVISYRGTDLASTGLPYFNDVWNGWSVGAGDVGFAGPSQATLARQFFNSVFRPDPNEIVVTANIELVGHSLGGGLAGFVASKLGGTAYIYDHMPFGLAAWAQTIAEALDRAATATGVTLADAIAVLGSPTYFPLAPITSLVTAAQFLASFVEELDVLKPDFSHIHATSLEGEILSQVRNGTLQEFAGTISGIVATGLGAPALSVLLDAAGLFEGLTTSALEGQIPYVSEQYLYGANIDSTAAHSMGLLTILQYAETQWLTDGFLQNVDPYFWTSAAADILPLVQDEAIASSLGLAQNETGAWSAGGQLAGIIAYSAIDEGERPFGDTGIRALLGDASDLGRSYYNFWTPQSLRSSGRDLGKLAVEYAGLLAYSQTLTSSDPTATDGVIQYIDATNASAERLNIDLRAATWTKGAVAHTISADTKNALTQDFIGALGQDTVERVYDWYAGVAGSGSAGLGLDVDRITVALSAGTIDAQPEGNGVSIIVLTDAGHAVTATNGRDVIIGGTGDDIIYGGDGNDILWGGGDPGNVWWAGLGNDELHGGDGRDLLIAGRGYDVLYGDDGADTFLFDGSGEAAMIYGGAGNDVYDLRGYSGGADLVINRGDGQDTLLTDADSFNYGALRLTADGGLPNAPISPVEVYLPDRSLADVEVIWQTSVTDTLQIDEYTIKLLHGHIILKDKVTSEIILDMGEFVGTKTTNIYNNQAMYDFSTPKGPRIHFHDPLNEDMDSDFSTIGDGIWPGLIVI